MAEQWQDNSITAAEIKDDDEAPDDWEAELEEKVCLFNLFIYLVYYHHIFSI